MKGRESEAAEVLGTEGQEHGAEGSAAEASMPEDLGIKGLECSARQRFEGLGGVEAGDSWFGAEGLCAGAMPLSVAEGIWRPGAEKIGDKGLRSHGLGADGPGADVPGAEGSGARAEGLVAPVCGGRVRLTYLVLNSSALLLAEITRGNFTTLGPIPSAVGPLPYPLSREPHT